MCGIAGIVAPKTFAPGVLIAMTQVIRYRGPDGYGFAFIGRSDARGGEVFHNEERFPSTAAPVIGLGNRRLAILDTSTAGDQPMQIEDGRLSITYNGEIYNYREIRAELEQAGFRFRTGTDTEVILRSYQHWGPDCLQHFNGMWAFALWDNAKQRLFCARDRFGVKPFYYALHDGTFFLASEIKQILQASGMPRQANPRAIFDLLESGLADHSAQTFFAGVHQLSAGHSLTLDLSDTLSPVIRNYWELCLQPQQFKLTPAEATDEFHRLFKDAVKIRLRSDVPVGVSLSGGLDSSAILCQAKEIAPSTQFQTFSACFEDPEIDEREYMVAAASATGSVTHPSYPKAQEFWDNIEALMFHHDEPLGAARTFSQWRLMRSAREHGIPVVLGGQGADEALCGYQKYRYFYFWELFRQGNPKLLREVVMSWRYGTTNPQGKWASAARYLPGVVRRSFSPAERLCNPEFRRNSDFAPATLGAAGSIAERQKIDLTYSSIPAFLRHEDRNSMAHSIESRHPFLDYRLVEFAVNCPPDLKLRDGWSKWILRNAMKGILPDKVRLRRTKLGFDAPDATWMRLGLQNGHRELWDSPKLRMERFLHAGNLVRECKRFLQGAPSALPANSLFLAISLELWARVLNVS
jgi:asparagine synthase (glutamine-hydrolysing)